MNKKFIFKKVFLELIKWFHSFDSMKNKVNSQVLEKFKMAIFKQRLKKIEIADKMGITDGHLVNMLSGRDMLSDEKRAKLNEILKTNY